MVKEGRLVGDSGAVMVELAVVSVLLVTLFFGGLELLRAIDAHAQMTDGARAGARTIAAFNVQGKTECARHQAGEDAARQQMSRLIGSVGEVTVEVLGDEIPVGYSMRPAVRVRVSLDATGILRVLGDLFNVMKAESIFLIESGMPISECAKEQ